MTQFDESRGNLQRQLQQRTAFLVHSHGCIGIEVARGDRRATSVRCDVNDLVACVGKRDSLNLFPAVKHQRELTFVLNRCNRFFRPTADWLPALLRRLLQDYDLGLRPRRLLCLRIFGCGRGLFS